MSSASTGAKSLYTMWSIKLNKDRFKFSSSHFTIFNSQKAEALHGHNYYVTLEVSKSEALENGMLIDVVTLKKELSKILEPLDEKILLPKNSKFLKLEPTGSNLEVSFSNKKYSFPTEDVEVLNLENITMEELSKLISDQLKKTLAGFVYTVEVQETTGQSASYTVKKAGFE